MPRFTGHNNANTNYGVQATFPGARYIGIAPNSDFDFVCSDVEAAEIRVQLQTLVHISFEEHGTGGGGGGPGEGSGLTLQVQDDNFTIVEDSTLSENILENDETSQGLLRVLDYRMVVPGDDFDTVYRAGETASIPGVGNLRIRRDGTVTFTPNQNYAGDVPQVNCLITNGRDMQLSDLEITITPGNDAPVANGDARITLVNTPILIDVLSNDQDPDGTPLTITRLNGAPVSQGVPVDIGNATVTYQGSTGFLVTPDNGYEGSFTFTYTISDGQLTDTATVSVFVGVTNEPMFSAAAPISGPIGQANYNFGQTYMGRYGAEWNNGVNVTSPPFTANQGLFSLANREPWLYDRASTVYALYLRTQDETILDVATGLADTYFAGVEVNGSGLGRFTITGGDNGADPSDVKYLYPLIGVWYENETGLSIHRAKSIALYNQILLSFSKTYNANSPALWTERNAAFSILGCTSAYWLHRKAGNRAAAATALQDAIDYFNMVETMSAASGAPLHGHNQHEGSAITTPISSPWMGAFLVEAVLQLHRTMPDDRYVEWIAGYGDFLIQNAFYVTDEGDLDSIQGLRLPAYLVANNQTPRTYAEGELLDMEHAADVAALIKKVIWAKGELSQSVSAFNTLLGELETVAEEVFLYWTRNTPQMPAYRLMPPRKGGWWFRNGYSDTALFFTGRVPVAPLAVTNVSISGSAQQGSLLTVTPGTWDGFPAPTLTYQWYRGAIPIAGATNSTYTTQLADVGLAVSVREIANAGPFQSSNTITVVAAGAPEITAHPSTATAQAGETAQFSATCTATPTATFQWQVSTNGGSSWSNVAEGTGGSGTDNTTTYTTEVLASDDNGDRYRCAFTNTAGTTHTNSATLAMVVDQGSARFASNTAGASFTFDIGGAGYTNFTWEALMYFEGNSGGAQFGGVRHLGNGRSLGVQCANNFPSYTFALGNSQTGAVAWSSPPPLNTWVHVTIQSPNQTGGTVRASWAPVAGSDDTRQAVTQANGVEASVQAQATWLGGQAIGVPSQAAVRFQYVRARTGYMDDATVLTHRRSTDPTGWAFWWRFFDAGGGTVGVEDETGNNRVPTLTNATFATGPVIGGM